MLLLSLFLNHKHHLHNPHVHNYNYRLHNRPYNNIDLNNPVSSYNNLESQDPFDIYTSYTQILFENDSFFMANKPPLTNKTILHPPLRHLHNYHKRKHQTEMNIPLLTKIPLYDFMMKTWMILLRMRINSSLITPITKAMTKLMTRVLANHDTSVTSVAISAT